jgi:hypothetical protein
MDEVLGIPRLLHEHGYPLIACLLLVLGLRTLWSAYTQSLARNERLQDSLKTTSDALSHIATRLESLELILRSERRG